MYEHGSLDPEIAGHYNEYDEGGRLFRGLGRFELVRVRELLRRSLPSPPAVILDVGGGEGVHALWLAREGYQVHLIDAHSPHVEAARKASSAQPGFPIASCQTGDARRLEESDGSADAVLLFGPLYHLTERRDRLKALREARRVLVDGGRLFAIAVSRFASTFDGFRHGYFEDPRFEEIAARDRRDGQHRNAIRDSRFFTTAYFHRPEDLASEVEEAEFKLIGLFGVQGVARVLSDFDHHWEDEHRREHLLEVVRSLETEPSLLGLSNHIMAVGEK